MIMNTECYDIKFSFDFKFNIGGKVYNNKLTKLNSGQNKLQTKWIGPYVMEET